AQELFEHWTEIINIAKDLLVNTQEKQNVQANKKQCYLELNEEDLVLLNSTNIISQKSAKRASKKLIAKLIGPFKIFRDEVRKEPPEIATKDPEEHEKDHPLYDATWEPLTNLENYKDLVKEFEKTGETVLNRGECKGTIGLHSTMHISCNEHDYPIWMGFM
ncbi:741_t:CDS:2, partial [Racocetra persica]